MALDICIHYPPVLLGQEVIYKRGRLVSSVLHLVIMALLWISNAHFTAAEKSLATATQRIGLRPHPLLYKTFAAELQEIPRTLAIPLAMVKI